MRLSLDANGSPAEFADWILDDAGKGTYAGIAAATAGMKADFRSNIERSGLGHQLGNAVGSKMYPPTASKGSLRAAGIVFARGSKAEAIFDAFNSGVVIKAHNGKWLAIPTPQASRGGRGVATTPENFQERTGIELRFVPSRKRNDVALLVGRSVHAKSGRGRRAATERRLNEGRAAEDVVFFVLIRQAFISQRLVFDAIAQYWGDRAPDLVAAATPSA